MSLDQDQVSDFARNYTDAWCSGDPTRVAAHFAPGGTIAINGGPPTEVTEVVAYERKLGCFGSIPVLLVMSIP